MTPPLPIVRLRLHVRTEAPLTLPPYAGSMLRGAFGHSLLALAPLPHEDGKPCALYATCPYCQVFAPPPLPEHSLQKFSQMPAPYVIEPPRGGARRLRSGQTFDFNLVLIGNALEHLSVLLQAWERAMRIGLGPQRSSCTLLVAVDEDGHKYWPDNGRHPSSRQTVLTPSSKLSRRATLHLSTPLRLQLQGKPVRTAQQLDARTLLITLARRCQLLMDVHLGARSPQLDFAELIIQTQAVRLQSDELHWFDWGRFSQRQQREMKFGGLLGRIHLQGDLTPFSELLHVGQWIHVGKNASFGLGGYRLSAI